MSSHTKLLFLSVMLLLILLSTYFFVSSPSDSGIAFVRIGEQEWMQQNLNTDTFRNGDLIPEARSNDAWKEACENKQPAWCYYNNNSDLGETYGKLYNVYAVLDPRGLVPAGWHIASAEEWDELIAFCGGKETAGDALKETGTEHWKEPNDGATNSSGFTALPGGTRTPEFSGLGGFEDLGTFGIWWTSSVDTRLKSIDAHVEKLAHFNHRVADYGLMAPEAGLSVRCVRD